MKKLLSTFLVMALLLAALPLGGIGVSAANPALNLMGDGDFENFYYSYNWTTYQNTYVCYDAALHGVNGAYLMGNGGWGSMLEQDALVELGKAYRLEFWYKVINNGFNWRLEQGCFDGLYETRWETATEWTRVTFDFVATSPRVILNFCGSGNGIREAAYVDDVVLTPLPAADFDGYVTNGGFERGDLSGWAAYQSTQVSADAAYFGNYGAHLQGNGSYGALLEQMIATKPGVEYTVAFSYKVNQNGFNLQVKNLYDQALAAVWLSESDGTEDDPIVDEETEYGWTEEDWTEDDWVDDGWIEDGWIEDGWADGELTFVADGNTALLNLCGGGNGIPEDAYVDDVYIYVSGEGDPDDLVDDGRGAWKTYQNTYWDTRAVYAGSYGIYLWGDGSWGALAERTLATVAGEEYTLSFWYQVQQNGFNLNIRDGVGGDSIQSGWFDATEWTYVEIPFTAVSDAVTLNFCGGGNGIEEIAYLDEVVLWGNAEEETPDADIRNGDFETGSLLGWSQYQGTEVNAAAAYDGEYGAFLIGDGGWGALLEQGFFTPGFTYALTFRYKVLSEGFNLNLVTGDTGETLAGGWYTSTEWEEVTLEFTTLSSTMRLNICGGGTGIPEVAYIDDISITCLDEDWGDIDLPTLQDAAILQQYLNGWDVEPPAYADIDGDDEINNKDLVLLLRFLNGWYWDEALPLA